MSYYQDKVIWIIGASSGIGWALAHALAQQGATLALCARRIDELTKLQKKLGEPHHIYPLDVADTEACMATAQTIEQDLGRIDSTLFLAALYIPSAIHAMDIKLAQKTVQVNVGGALNIIHALLPIYQRQATGQIALCASIAGYRGLPNGQPYSATKAALINLAETLYIEHPKLDIKVINPGFVSTPLTDKNTFEMPFILSPEQAADAITKGLKSKKFEIHFPKKLTYIMKFLRLLPDKLYFHLARKLR